MNEIKLEKRTEGERKAYLEGFDVGKRTGICIGHRIGGWIPVTEGLPLDGEKVEVAKAPSSVDAITGATYSSVAVKDAVNLALEQFRTMQTVSATSVQGGAQ